MRKWFTWFFLSLLSFSAFAQTDAKVEAVYTLGKIPTPLGVYNHVVQARIFNNGGTVLNNLPVTLTITGANSFTNTQLTSINIGESALVIFTATSLWNEGTNTLTVSVPVDDDVSNNAVAYSQLINPNTFSYADDSAPASSLGFGTGDGILLTKYNVSGSGIVRQVRAHISNSPINVGQTVYAVAATFGILLGQSANHVITAADLGTYVNFDLITPAEIDPENPLFIGLAQVSDGVTEYYPLSYQQETVPTRPDAYFASLLDGSGLTELNFIGRLMLEAVVDIGTEAPFNSNSSSPNYVIAGWDLSGANSPATFAATTFDQSLSSSNLLTRGPGAIASPGIHTFRTTGFQNDGINTSNTDYFQVTIAPKPGEALSLSSITANLHGNSNAISTSGINSQFAYSLNGVNFTLISFPVITTALTGTVSVNLLSISALQNVTSGTTVTFRYYASGEGATADWGLISYKPGVNALAVSGKKVSLASNSILTSPVVPTGADFTLTDCNSTATGSVKFTSTGTFTANNKYIVQLGQISSTHPGQYTWRYPVTVGTITSAANSGTINFTIPAGTNAFGSYAIRVLSTEPAVSGTLSQSFAVNGFDCRSQAENAFRSKASGDWNNINTWESQTSTGWLPSTLVPNDASSKITISEGNIVTVTTNVSAKKIDVNGTLQLLNDAVNKGMLTVLTAPFPGPFSMSINAAGTLQIAGSANIYNDVMLSLDGNIRVFGKIIIGDGLKPIAAGFESFALEQSGVFWNEGSAFEWNNNTAFPTNGITYFQDNGVYPTFRLTKIATGNLGGSENTIINAVLEVNTPATWSGTGTKTFTAGVTGSSTLIQAAGAGKFYTTAAYQELSPSANSNGSMFGIAGGNITLQLGTEGYTFVQGVTVPAGSNIHVSGPCLALQATAIQQNASATFETGSIFTVENGDLLNEGTLNGPGTIQFTGSNPSTLTSTGTLSTALLLTNKQLSLGSDLNSAAINLSNTSNLSLGTYNLDMATADLISNETNFVITNNTGRLSRYVGGTATMFPVGINPSSYTPTMIINTGNPDRIKVGVAPGVQGGLMMGNVDRTWNIGDSTQTGPNLSVNVQWNGADEQAGFDRTRCYISHYVTCPDGSCAGFFDSNPAANCNVTTAFSIQRNNISDFSSPAFVVSSKQFIYTFTGTGDWNDAANWTPAVVAPTVIPPGVEVYINGTGECFYNGNIKIKQGGKLKVEADKKLKIAGDFTTE